MFRHLLVLLLFALALTTNPQVPSGKGEPARTWGSATAKDLAQRALKLWQEHRTVEALALYSRGYEDARRHGHLLAAFWFLIGRGGSHYALLEYGLAMDDYLAARETALKAGLLPQAAIASCNLSSLYLNALDTSSALTAAEDAYRLLPRSASTRERWQVLIQLGRVVLIRGDGARAQPLFEQAIRYASSTNDKQGEAVAWDQIGWELMRAGDIGKAETALNNALRLRRSNNDPALYATEYFMALLHLKKGDIRLAREFIDTAFRAPGRDPLLIPLHRFYLARAQILHAQGELQRALGDFLRASQSADQWRARTLTADSFRVGADVALNEIYNGAVDTAIELYTQTKDRRYAMLSWQLDEHSRAASLRESLKQGGGWTARVPAVYWPTLDRLRALQAGRLARSDSAGEASSGEAVRLRMHLAEMEARAGAGEAEVRGPDEGSAPSSSRSAGARNFSETLVLGDSPTHIQAVLGNSRTLISFRRSATKMYRWLITGRRFELKVFDGPHDADITALRTAIRGGAGEANAYAAKVYSDLFGDIPRNGNSRWSVALDGDLFEIPLAALVAERLRGDPVYLVERRTIELVPGAWALGSHREVSEEGEFVGIGDGIYNEADPRYRPAASLRGYVPGLFATSLDMVQLPRLAASRQELIECSRRAGGPATLLMGKDANRGEFRAALARHPATIHIAAHFLSEGDGPNKTAIALGIAPDGAGHPQWELVTVDDIRSLRAPGAVVVMSGCSSAAGQAVPAAGLLGLSRAWLEAGARAVVATQWPVNDIRGDLFPRFYSYLGHGGRGTGLEPAEALRQAQIEILRASHPPPALRYWAAYQIFGRSN